MMEVLLATQWLQKGKISNFVYCHIRFFSPHLCVGFLFLILYPGCRLRVPPPPPAASLTLTIQNFTYNNFTYNNFTYNNFTHRNLAHLCHMPSLTSQLCHIPSLTSQLHTPSLTYHNFTHTQAWHLVTSTFVSRRFAWQAWHLWHCVARLVRICRLWRRGPLRGRRGTWWHPPWYHVAGVAQSRIHGRFAWQALHSWHWVAPLGPV